MKTFLCNVIFYFALVPIAAAAFAAFITILAVAVASLSALYLFMLWMNKLYEQLCGCKNK